MPPKVDSIQQILKKLGDENKPMTPNAKAKEENKLKQLMRSKERREKEKENMPSWNKFPTAKLNRPVSVSKMVEKRAISNIRLPAIKATLDPPAAVKRRGSMSDITT